MLKTTVALLAVSALIVTTASIAFADAPTPLGGLDLWTFCLSKGYAGVALTKPQVGPNAAHDNWRCFGANGDLHPFSMEQAWKWAYGFEQVQSHAVNPDDAYTWVCYSVRHQ